MEKIYSLFYRIGVWAWNLPNPVKLTIALADLAVWIFTVVVIIRWLCS